MGKGIPVTCGCGIGLFERFAFDDEPFFWCFRLLFCHFTDRFRLAFIATDATVSEIKLLDGNGARPSVSNHWTIAIQTGRSNSCAKMTKIA